MIERIQPANRVERNTSCSDQRIGVRVYDYYNGALEAEEVRIFEQHMIQCAYCEKVVLELDTIYFSLEDAELESGTGSVNQKSDIPRTDQVRLDRVRIDDIPRAWRKR